MTAFDLPWLSEDEVLFHRIEAFHRQRVEAIASGRSPIGKRDEGILVVHLIPTACAKGRTRFDGETLKRHGAGISPPGDRGSYSRFNVDGLLNYSGHEEVFAYSQLFRDGRLEAVMPDVAYLMDRQQNGARCLRGSICEKAVFETVAGYLQFCRAIELSPPIQMFSALIGCAGVRICTDWSFRDLSTHGIDRSPAFLPEIEITAINAEPTRLLRPWCDTLWQACGMERSFNFDQQGTWRERRR